MILRCWKCLEALTKVNDSELHLHSGISVNWLMIRVNDVFNTNAQKLQKVSRVVVFHRI